MNIRKVVSADGNVITVRDNSQSFTNNKRFKAGKIPWLKKESKLNNEPCINAIKPVFVFKDEQLIESSAQEAAKEALITVHFLKKAIESGEEINGVVYKKC